MVNRYVESTTRPAAFEELGHAIVHVRKVLEQYSQGDEKYNHIEKADMEKVSMTDKIHFLSSFSSPLFSTPLLS